MKGNNFLMRIAAAMLFAVAMFATASAFAQTTSGTCGENATWVYDESTHTLTISGTGAMADYDFDEPWENLEIQSVIINDGITRIGKCAFCDAAGLTSVTIPNSVESIGNWAFYLCDKIIIPSSVTRIGEEAFFWCGNIEYYGNAEGSPWKAYCRNGYIEGDFVYSDNTKKEIRRYIGKGGDVVIPDGVITIGDEAFYYFNHVRKLLTITIPESVASIGSGAFQGNNLTALTIPKNVTHIGKEAFGSNENLATVYFKNDPEKLSVDGGVLFGFSPTKCYVSPESFPIWEIKFGTVNEHGIFCPEGREEVQNGVVYFLSDNGKAAVFNHTSDLPSVLEIPATITKDGVVYRVTTIYKDAFRNCKNLTSVIIPEGVISIGPYAFANCSNLSSVIISEGVKQIEKETFSGCSKLSSVTIPESVTSIGDYAFFQANPAEVWWYASPDLFEGVAFYNSDSPTEIHVPFGTETTFNDNYVSKYRFFIGDIKRMSDESITIPAQTYTGKALTPVVKDGDKILIEGEDYTITLPEGGCINAGEYTVTLTAKNPLYYKSAEKTFVINPAPVTATDDITLSSVKIWSFNKTIFVENAAQEIVIVDMSGRIVKTIKPESSRTEILLKKSGVYIVKTGIKTQKVSIQ